MQALDPFAFLEAITERPAWHHQAACLGLTDMFFPERGESSLPAKAVCATCPVQAQCRAQGEKERFGIWGGLSGYDRRPSRIIQNMKRNRARQARKPAGPRAVKGAASGTLPQPPPPAATAQAGGVPRGPLPRLRPSA